AVLLVLVRRRSRPRLSAVAIDAGGVRVANRVRRVARRHAAADGGVAGGARQRCSVALGERRTLDHRLGGAGLTVLTRRPVLSGLAGSSLRTLRPGIALRALLARSAVLAVRAVTASLAGRTIVAVDSIAAGLAGSAVDAIRPVGAVGTVG